MSVEHLDIAAFTRTPNVRYRKDGSFSGEEYREAFLEPALERSERIVVELDSIQGYSSSFFEEAFGGLVRKYGLPSMSERITFHARRRGYLIPMIQVWMREAAEDPKPAKGPSAILRGLVSVSRP